MAMFGENGKKLAHGILEHYKNETKYPKRVELIGQNRQKIGLSKERKKNDNRREREKERDW